MAKTADERETKFKRFQTVHNCTSELPLGPVKVTWLLGWPRAILEYRGGDLKPHTSSLWSLHKDILMF